MMKKLLSVLSFLFVIHSSSALAHPGGHGVVNENQAMAIALYAAESLVDFDAGLGFGRLEESWRNLPEEVTRIHARGNGYYIIGVENTYEKKTLFVLMSEGGEVYDANFSGEFEGLQ